MHGYVVSRPVVLRNAMQVKHIPASADLNKVEVANVQIDALHEQRHVREYLMRRFPDVPMESLVKVVPYERLATWALFPMQLGRMAKDDAPESQVLENQLLELRARHPQRKRFRILLNNGFGTNLGDTLIGLTAFRAVWALLKAALPEVSVDVLLGWAPLKGVSHLLKQQEGVEQVLHQGPTLQAMARYQGLFDFAGLIGLPGFGEIAPVDWYLWWMGLDHVQVPAADKRNRISVDPDDSAAVANSLRDVVGAKILINPKASDSLRRMPDATLRSLAQAVLAENPANRVVFDQPVDFEHPRAIHLPDLINSPKRLAALVAQVQGVITPDTFVQHVADATGTPTCTLNASVPAEFFRYYPMVQTRVLPGAESLGGWGRTKVSPKEWEVLAPAYTQAWSRLEPATVLAALKQAGLTRERMSAADVSRIDKPRRAFHQQLVTREALSGHFPRPLGQRADATSEALQRQLLKLAGRVIVPGDTVVLLGTGAGELAPALAERVGSFGRLVVFEPRRMIHHLFCANMLDAGHAHVESHPVMPTGSHLEVHPLPCLTLQDDHDAMAESNQLVCEPVIHWPLDRLEIPHCRLVVLQSPLPLLPALRGAAGTVARNRPFIMAGLIKSEELTEWQGVLGAHDYMVRHFLLKDLADEIASPPSRPKNGSLILVAQPRKSAVSRGRS